MIETWITAAMAGTLIAVGAGTGVALMLTRTGKEKRQDLKAEIETLEKALERMHRQANDLRSETAELRGMKEEADRIKNEYASLDERKAELEAWAREEVFMLDKVEAKRRATNLEKEEVNRLKEEEAALQARKARLEVEVKEAEDKLEAVKEVHKNLKATDVKRYVAEAKLEETEKRIEKTADAANAAQAVLEAAEQARKQVEERLSEAETAAAKAEEKRVEVAKTLAEQQVEAERIRGEIADVTQARDALLDQIGTSEKRIEELKEEVQNLSTRRDMLKEDLEGLRGQGIAENSSEASGAGRLGNLTEPPHLWFPQTAKAAPRIEEQEKLEQAIKAIRDQGLSFRDRVVHRFHTALKVSRISPLTVLAGISGTGKTQLPRAYARAMGMERLVVPVQPRWDGPRDLLGHFDFLHRRFQATELARLLYDYTHVEPNPIGDTGGYRLTCADQRMAIVLLDEMNLARTEYYFSEFLSRLELQDKRDEEPEAPVDRDRMVELDIPYLEDRDAVRVFPTQRILWVGTMNEDESTMTLSDKAIDRANVMRFARPKDMDSIRTRKSAEEVEERAPERYLPASVWNEWCSAKQTTGNTGEMIERINEKVMEPYGRSFGHRMREAMMKYVEVYTGRSWEEGLADQIEMRLLPKLQGVDAQMDNAGGAFGLLAQICDEDLKDSDLAESIRQAQEEMQQTGTFSWKGRELP